MSEAMEDRPTDIAPGETPEPTADASASETAPAVTPETAPTVTPEPEAGATTPRATGSAIPPEELERLTTDIIAALKSIYDPEIPADIYELGLIYKVDIDDDRNVAVDMTLTAPGCPVAGEMPGWVENAVSLVAGVGQVNVSMVFDPPWTPDRMSDEARVALDWY
ncbi:MAG: SUF system Fe-S cluster assembly protein [Bauldia litoralis]